MDRWKHGRCACSSCMCYENLMTVTKEMKTMLFLSFANLYLDISGSLISFSACFDLICFDFDRY